MMMMMTTMTMTKITVMMMMTKIMNLSAHPASRPSFPDGVRGDSISSRRSACDACTTSKARSILSEAAPGWSRRMEEEERDGVRSAKA
jgi:hypothetical protein